MFGIYRTALALFVVIQHVYGVSDIGSYAVHAFFCLSGFLMTLLMCETYKGRPFDFAVNRFLRLFPAYWVIAGATALMILPLPLVPDMFGKGPFGWGLPLTPADVTRNILFLDSVQHIELIPTSWAVSNELIFYVLISFGATATLRRSLIGLGRQCRRHRGDVPSPRLLFPAVRRCVVVRGRRDGVPLANPSRFPSPDAETSVSNRRDYFGPQFRILEEARNGRHVRPVCEYGCECAACSVAFRFEIDRPSAFNRRGDRAPQLSDLPLPLPADAAACAA